MFLSRHVISCPVKVRVRSSGWEEGARGRGEGERDRGERERETGERETGERETGEREVTDAREAPVEILQ